MKDCSDSFLSAWFCQGNWGRVICMLIVTREWIDTRNIISRDYWWTPSITVIWSVSKKWKQKWYQTDLSKKSSKNPVAYLLLCLLSSRIMMNKLLYPDDTYLVENESWNHSPFTSRLKPHITVLCLAWGKKKILSELLEICNSVFPNSLSLVTHASSARKPTSNTCVREKGWVGWAERTIQAIVLTSQAFGICKQSNSQSLIWHY